MLNKSLWGVALTMVAGLGLLLTPGTGESRGGGGHGGGGHGGGGHGGGFHGGGFHGGGFHGGGFHGGGFHGGGFARGGFGRGFYGYGGGFYGAGLGYPYYGSDWGSPYYGADYYPGYYTSDWASPSYNTAPPATYYVQPSVTVVPETAYYGGTGSASYAQPAVNPNDATFTVRLPDPNAEVWFQDYKTQERGTVREFDSAALQPGTTYTFHIRARWNQNGQPVEQTRDVPARAGQHLTVDFQQPTN